MIKVISADGWYNATKDDVILLSDWLEYINTDHYSESDADEHLWDLVENSITYNPEIHEIVEDW